MKACVSSVVEYTLCETVKVHPFCPVNCEFWRSAKILFQLLPITGDEIQLSEILFSFDMLHLQFSMDIL
jgi:hypothetical protein